MVMEPAANAQQSSVPVVSGTDRGIEQQLHVLYFHIKSRCDTQDDYYLFTCASIPTVAGPFGSHGRRMFRGNVEFQRGGEG